MMTLVLALLLDDALPSWREGEAKRAILDFVRRAAAEVAPSDRVAVVDNDGTLWSEQPAYVQHAFIVDRVKALCESRPELSDRTPFKQVLEGRAFPESNLPLILASIHAGLSVDEFRDLVQDWISTSRHPRFDRLYTDLAYQPMLELLAHLKANGFLVYIVSGGGSDFLRVFAERVYGIPPERVVGSVGALKYEKGTIWKRPGIEFLDDGPGKPVGIHRQVGRRPILAIGNSDGDQAMLEWTTSGPGPRLGVLIRHTDAEREWAYDRASKVGRLDRALDAAPAAGWTVVDMKRDWNVIYPFQQEERP